MKNILLFGAGKSATCLIDYLCQVCLDNNWHLRVSDADLQLAASKIKGCPAATAISVDVSNGEPRSNLIQQADIVISMLPPHLHLLVAVDCLAHSKNLLTASYIDPEIKKLGDQIAQKGLLFLYEMGLDPGIDHMSAMQVFDSIRQQGGKVTSFRSHCGGLVAPESDDNPWHYKITWNPGNIVMAGASGAIYKWNNSVLTIPYSEVFAGGEIVDIPGLFPLAWYPNRDSLSYCDIYGLQEAATFIRTTLRHPSFCRGWNTVVNLGLTDLADFDDIRNCQSYRHWFELKRQVAPKEIAAGSRRDEFEEQAAFLGLFSDDHLEIAERNSAKVLQGVLENKLGMHPGDKDMIVMLHEIGFEAAGKKREIKSCLIVKGDDQQQTAMAKTVGYPLGIAAKLILQDSIRLKGLHIPVAEEIYKPVLTELATRQIVFEERKS